MNGLAHPATAGVTGGGVLVLLCFGVVLAYAVWAATVHFRGRGGCCGGGGSAPPPVPDKEIGPQHKSIIDRCVAQVYREAARTGVTPTLCTLREKLLEQPEFKAQELALTLELFTTGSLDAFGHESNVDLDKRVVVFNIRDLSETMKPAGLLVITDTILNRVTLNWKKGKRTHVFIDEFHMVFNTDQGAEFFTNAWRQFRKRNAYPTAITQNVEYLLDSVQASTMGLIRYGRSLVPFINRFPKNTELYRLMTTKPGEGVFGGGSGDA